jgi:hypothetical protein
VISSLTLNTIASNRGEHYVITDKKRVSEEISVTIR